MRKSNLFIAFVFSFRSPNSLPKASLTRTCAGLHFWDSLQKGHCSSEAWVVMGCWLGCVLELALPTGHLCVSPEAYMPCQKQQEGSCLGGPLLCFSLQYKIQEDGRSWFALGLLEHYEVTCQDGDKMYSSEHLVGFMLDQYTDIWNVGLHFVHHAMVRADQVQREG